MTIIAYVNRIVAECTSGGLPIDVVKAQDFDSRAAGRDGVYLGPVMRDVEREIWFMSLVISKGGRRMIRLVHLGQCRSVENPGGLRWSDAMVRRDDLADALHDHFQMIFTHDEILTWNESVFSGLWPVKEAA